MKDKKEIWDKVYSKYSKSELPWHKLTPPKEILEKLSTFKKDETMLVPGCGTGESIEILRKMGFQEIIGTDISDIAVQKAKEIFPNIKFENTPTEELHKKISNTNTLDWLNLHQIPSEDLHKYLKSLQEISNNLILTYIFEPEKGEIRDSYITGDKVYNYKPEKIIEILNKMKAEKVLNFEFQINPKFGDAKHKAVAIFFSKTNP